MKQKRAGDNTIVDVKNCTGMMQDDTAGFN